MAPSNGDKNSSPPPLLALILRPGAAIDQQAAALAARIQEFHSTLKSAFSNAVASMPPQVQALLPHNLHSSASEITRRARRARLASPLRNHNFAAVIPGDSLAELVITRGLTNFFNIYNTLLIVRIVFTWFPEAPRAIVNPISTVCDPYLNLFRGLIPPLGGTLDFSPILAFLLLDAFSNAAAALPAELPSASPDNQPATSWRKKQLRKNQNSP